MDIAHLAQRAPVILYAESSVVAAVDLMRRNHVDCAPVVDEAGRLVGELRLPLRVDAMRKASHGPNPLRVGAIMSWEVRSVCSSASAQTGIERMHRRGEDTCYVVTPKLRLLGTVTRTALEQAIATARDSGSELPGDHACRGRWCRHSGFCTGDQSQRFEGA